MPCIPRARDITIAYKHYYYAISSTGCIYIVLTKETVLWTTVYVQTAGHQERQVSKLVYMYVRGESSIQSQFEFLNCLLSSSRLHGLEAAM